MAESKIKYGAQLAAKIEPDVMQKFIENAERCKSTKDIVLRELVYAFNRYCADGRYPVLQTLSIASPGYTIEEGKVVDAGVIMLPEPGAPTTYHQSIKAANVLSAHGGDLLRQAAAEKESRSKPASRARGK